jgi:hypothetical protein
MGISPSPHHCDDRELVHQVLDVYCIYALLIYLNYYLNPILRYDPVAIIVKDKHPPAEVEYVVFERPLFLARPRPPARKRGQTLPVQLDTVDKVLGDAHGPEAAATAEGGPTCGEDADLFRNGRKLDQDGLGRWSNK